MKPLTFTDAVERSRNTSDQALDVLSWGTLTGLAKAHGLPYYILDSHTFEDNYDRLLASFRGHYPRTSIGYSYKTNYTPRLCKLVDQKRGYAEVVSSMELQLARELGVPLVRVIFNGPVKEADAIRTCLLGGGVVNLDSLDELPVVEALAQANPQQALRVGLRCNFPLGDSFVSRFGFDVEGDDFPEAVSRLRQYPNIRLGLHCHFPNRDLESFIMRTERMLELVRRSLSSPPDFIDLGGGFFGRVDARLAAQFRTRVATYEEYADAIAARFARAFQNLPEQERPELILEPGTALVGDAMWFVAKVVGLKTIRGRTLATVTGSRQNILPTPSSVNLPLDVVHQAEPGPEAKSQRSLDIVGYTCIENDYLYHGYDGPLAVGDFVIFKNVGSYSIVLKPPFISPNGAVLERDPETGSFTVVKRKEELADLFVTFTSSRP